MNGMRRSEHATELKGGDRLYDLFKQRLAKEPPTHVI